MAQQQQYGYNPARPGGGRVGMQAGGYSVQHPAQRPMHALPPQQQQQRPMQAQQQVMARQGRPLQQQRQLQQPPRPGTVMHYGQGVPQPPGMAPHPSGRPGVGVRPSYVPQQQPMPQQQGQHSIQIQRVPNTLHMNPGLSMANTRRLSHDPDETSTRDIPSPHLRGGFPPSSPSLADLGHIDLNNRPPQGLGDHSMQVSRAGEHSMQVSQVSRPQMTPQDMQSRANIMRTNMPDFHSINPKLQQDNGMLLRVDTNGLHRAIPASAYGVHINGDPRGKPPTFLHGLSDLDLIDEDILARLIIELGLDRMRELPELWLSHNELEMDLCRQVPPQRAVRC